MRRSPSPLRHHKSARHVAAILGFAEAASTPYPYFKSRDPMTLWLRIHFMVADHWLSLLRPCNHINNVRGYWTLDK